MSESSLPEIRVLLIDDHTSFREPLAFMMEREPDLTVVAQAESLEEGREIIADEDLAVDIAVVDLDLPDGSGVEFVSDLRVARPRTMSLILSAYSEYGRLAEAIEAGASGVLHKSSRLGEIVDAVRRLKTGEHLLSQQEVIEAIRQVSRERRESHEARLMIQKLTPREKEVLQALAEGSSDKEISEKLYLGIGTVRSHVANILAKLEVQSRLQALVFAARHGIVSLD